MIRDYDVLIIGGGAAACMAALEASKLHLKVGVVDKGRVGRSGSTITSGGASSVVLPPERGGHPEDSDAVHLRDIVVGGEYLSDQEHLQIYLQEATSTVEVMEELGVRYLKTPNGEFIMFQSLGRSYPRLCLPELSAIDQMEVLRREILHRGVQLIEGVMITDLVQTEGRVVGAVGLDVLGGENVSLSCRAVILAMGSGTDLYRYASANFRTCGTAYALAYQAGATLLNMEFVEFTLIPCPGGVPVPTGGISPLPGHGAVFYNNEGEPFMSRYDPVLKDRASRSQLMRAVWQENKEGRGPVKMDATMVENYQPARMLLDRKFRALGLDHRTQPLEWVPAVHTFLGGARINAWGATDVPGLFAAGESAGHGAIFGADRIGTAIAASHVWGIRAARGACCFVKKAKVEHSQELWREKELALESRKGRAGKEVPRDVKRRLQEQSSTHLNIARTGQGLEAFLNQLPELENDLAVASTKTMKDQVQALETECLLVTGELVARAALARTETRGQHWREDYPQSNNPKWLKWIAQYRQDQKDILSYLDIPLDEYPLQPATND